MSWENDLRTALRELDVPDHGPDFWVELDRQLEAEQPVERLRHQSIRRWRTPALVAGLAASLVVLMIALPTSLTSTVLAYSYSQGIYVYDLSYFDSTSLESTGEGPIVPGPDVSTEVEGSLIYTVEDDPDSDTQTIRVQADVTGANNLDGAIEDIPEVSFVVDPDGEFVRALGPESFPGFVLPQPLPGSSLYAGLPFGFGPPFPDHPLGVGDSWTTAGPRAVFVEDGPQFTAEHRVVGEEEIADRATLIINSVYETPAFAVPPIDSEAVTDDFFHGPELVEVTVWFDPADGIIVRAELDQTTTSETRHDNGQTIISHGVNRIVVELIDEE
jgi:hypothetical protein